MKRVRFRLNAFNDRLAYVLRDAFFRKAPMEPPSQEKSVRRVCGGERAWAAIAPPERDSVRAGR